MKNINERCPLQSECGQKTCKYPRCELNCSYYDANARPGCEIEDQEELRQSRWNGSDTGQAAPAESTPEVDSSQQINGLMTYLPVSSLHPHPDNPRKDLGDLTELADSIRANGIFQNLTVVPIDEAFEQFTVVIGHRRLAAAKLAGLTEVPCVIAQMTAKEQMQTMLLENMQRSELTVYEQAQGFQMMIDLGSSVEEISDKSGFSETTVRRRLKMMELDQDILKEVSSRQLSLSDFDRLAQIEDIADRNECLSKIGTSDFNAGVSYRLRKQETKKNLPLVMEQLKNLGAKEIPANEHYSSKYSQIDSCYISDWKEGTPLLSKKVSGQLFYYIEDYSDRIVFAERSKRAEPVRRSAEEIERDKQITKAWVQLDEKSAVAYKLRSEFVENLSYGKRNAELILRGALIYGIINANRYMSSDGDSIRDILGLDGSDWAHDRAAQAVDALHDVNEKRIPALVYALFNDGAKESWSDSYRKAYPKHKVSAEIKGLYAWLTSLGYEMSEEERQLLNGTHELFHLNDVKSKTNEE